MNWRKFWVIFFGSIAIGLLIFGSTKGWQVHYYIIFGFLCGIGAIRQINKLLQKNK